MGIDLYREIILLAASKKHSNYCIAGIDQATGAWVRIVSNNPYISDAVTSEDMRFEDGSMPKLLDIIRIPILSPKPNYYQPENYLLDNTYYWEKVGKANATDVAAKYTGLEDYIFYNNGKSVESDYIKQVNKSERYSLIAIIPEDLVVHVRQWPEGKKVTMSFSFNDIKYQYFPVTDVECLDEYTQYDEGRYIIRENVLMVISLGENYHGAHYKLISGLIRF